MTTEEMLQSNYEDCLKFIETTTNTKLYPYQKIMLYYMLQGREVRSCRGCGRSMLAKGIGQYITKRLSEQDYTKRPEIVINADTVIEESDLINKHTLETAKRLLGDEQFEIEYYGKVKR